MIKAIQNSKIKIFYLVIGLVAATTFFVLQLSSKVNAEGERTGSPSFVLDEERDFPYIMMFARNKGVKTVDNVHLSTTNCCNCGAVIDVDDVQVFITEV